MSLCTFTDIETYMDKNAGIILVVDGVKMIQNKFSNCSRIIGKVSDNWGAPLQFTSNIVVNSTAVDETGNMAGALLRGAWTYYCQTGHKFDYNIFVNVNNDGGSIIEIPSKTFQYGALIHNNTVYGYKHFISDTYSTADWSVSLFNNLFASSSGAFYPEIRLAVTMQVAA